MTHGSPGDQEHPRGTLFLIALYGLLFVVGWFVIYVLLYLGRGGVTA
jgi:hypothetical protein